MPNKQELKIIELLQLLNQDYTIMAHGKNGLLREVKPGPVMVKRILQTKKEFEAMIKGHKKNGIFY